MIRIVTFLLLASALCGAQTLKIVVAGQNAETIADWQTASDKVKLVQVTSETAMSEIADADAYIGNIRPELVEAGKKLRWVQTLSAGVEQVLHKSGSDALADSDIVLTNNQIVQGPEIADHAMAFLLTLTRFLPTYLKRQADENWQARPYELFELNGKNALVIGMGGIGLQIAIRAWAHGMKVVGVDPEDIAYLPYVDSIVKPDMLDSVIGDADVVFMAAPHTPESHRMIGPSQFESMKDGAYFIAVSRGGTYDLGSLVKALDSKKLAGAGVDVTDPEPLPKGHALWKFENVIITPHIAGRSDMDRGRMLGVVKSNIQRFADGLRLINVVDKQKGY
ncbi:MAG: D-2-hydroxyacid dehydrogenase [Bryobacterales bacterium]|nr:D-2-hydroxyacid dehydrogenase [Bryobacterales bacterium]